MISFKQFLAEKAMNRGEFAKTAARQGNAKVGFEFEFVVPPASKLLAKPEDNRDSVELRNIDSIDEVNEYFEVSRSDLRLIEREFENWQEAVIENWIDENVDSDLVDSEGERYARQKARDDFESKNSHYIRFEEFVDAEYSTMYRFIESYGLQPRHGWEADLGNDRSRVYIEDDDSNQNPVVRGATFENIEEDLSDHLGQNVTVAYRTSKEHFDRGDWMIVADGSVTPTVGGVGLEVVSPPAPLGQALKNLKSMFNWMDLRDIETNTSTGLHINISLPNMSSVDLLKLVLFMGDKYVLKQFDRLKNTYTVPQTQSIMNNLAGSGKLPKDANEMIEIARAALSSQKYSSVHIEKMKDGYLEFRVAGDMNYHKKYDLVHDTVLRFVTALEVAANPNAERKEYLKKVSKILGHVERNEHNEDFEDKSIADVLEIGDQEATLTNLNTWLSNAKAGKITGDATKERLNDWVQNEFLKGLFKAFSELGIKKVSDKQRAEFKVLLKRLGMMPADLNGPADPWKDDVLRKLGIRK